MSIALVLVALLVVVVVVMVLVRALRSRPSDGVANFRRQIDALSPEARRPVVDQVQQLEGEADAPDATDAPPSRPREDDT